MSVLQQGVIVIDANYNQTTDECAMRPIPAKDDIHPATLIFMSSVVGLMWWIIGMLVYVKNTTVIQNAQGSDTIPLVWMWSYLGHT